MCTKGFHQANLISSNLDIVRAEVLAKLQSIQNNVLEAMTNVQPPAEPSQTQTANEVIQDQQMANLVAFISNLT